MTFCLEKCLLMLMFYLCIVSRLAMEAKGMDIENGNKASE